MKREISKEKRAGKLLGWAEWVYAKSSMHSGDKSKIRRLRTEQREAEWNDAGWVKWWAVASEGMGKEGWADSMKGVDLGMIKRSGARKGRSIGSEVGMHRAWTGVGRSELIRTHSSVYTVTHRYTYIQHNIHSSQQLWINNSLKHT